MTATLSNIIIYESAEVLRRALNNTDEVSVIDEYGYTPLIETIIVDDIDKFKLVLEANPDLNQKDITGRTALHWAVFNKKDEICRLLIEKGADVNAYNMTSEPAITRVLLREDKELIQLFVEHGANIMVARDYINVKLLGHRFELQGSVDIVDVNGEFTEVDFEGFYMEFCLALIGHSIDMFRSQYISRALYSWFDELDGVAQALKRAQVWLKYDHYLTNAALHEQEIRSWLKVDPLVIPVNQEGHAFVLVKCGDFFAICDRSEFQEGNDSIPLYYMNRPSRLNKELILDIVYQKQKIKNIYQGLIKALGLFEVARIPLRSQITGNCSWANVEAVLPVLFYMLHSRNPEFKEAKKKDMIADSIELFSRWREWDTGRALQFFMQQFKKATPARKASIGALLCCIVFQRLSADVEDHVELAKHIFPLLKTKGYEYIIDSYIHYYTYERSTEVGKNFKKLLEIYEREDGMS